MQIKCPCGKRLQVPDSAAGKRVKCPSCRKVLEIPAAAAVPPPAPSVAPGADSEKLVVVCSCGTKMAVPVSAAGKRVRCPKCKETMDIPAPPAADEFGVAVGSEPGDDFELDFNAGETPSPGASAAGEGDGNEYGIAAPKCPNCGRALDPGAQFCIGCGTHLGSGSKVDGIDVDAIQQEKQRRKKTKIVVASVIGAVVVVFGVSAALIVPRVNWESLKFWESKSGPKSSDSGSKGGDKTGEGQQSIQIEKKGDEDYLTFLIRGPARQELKLALASTQQAVAAFEIDKGRFPASVDELQQEMGTLAELPDGTEYAIDPETGTVDWCYTDPEREKNRQEYLASHGAD